MANSSRLSSQTILMFLCIGIKMRCVCALNGLAEPVSVPVGHLKPLGSHRPAEGNIAEVEGLVGPKDFFNDYIAASKPVLFKGGAKNIPAYKMWTDDFLMEKYGKLVIDVEEGKKENRSQNLVRMPLGQFLETYRTEEIYMVQDVLPVMYDELTLPKPLWCGGMQDELELGVLWFSSGGTKSVLHTDSVDNINCLLDGEKQITFIDKREVNRVEDKGFEQEGTYSNIDIEAVDLLEFPQLAEVPWWNAKMEKGDCLYIPYKWYHTVASSPPRNLAFNLWFVHRLWFNQTDCDSQKTVAPEHDSLEHYTMGGYPSNMAKVRSDAFMEFEGLAEIPYSKMVELWQSYGDEEDILALFEIIDSDKNFVLSWEEVYTADFPSLLQDFAHLLTEMPPHEIEELLDEADYKEDEEEEYDDDAHEDYDHEEL